MINEKSLVIYKNRPAIVTGIEAEKICIKVFSGDTLKVRVKDIELLHGGPCTQAELEKEMPQANPREAWELLADDNAPPMPLKELAELIYGSFNPRSALAAWELLSQGFFFSGDTHAIIARPRKTVEEEEKKRQEKEQEAKGRNDFLERMKKRPPEFLQTDRRFVQDIEALARGLSDKSRTLKELGRTETPEEAHRLLLASGAWTVWENPHPMRFGLGFDSAKTVPPPLPEEERLDLSGLKAYAIDSPWSEDPDDAVSLEGPDGQGCYTLWVHVADPAASILPESPADIEARGRGATLYLPEGPCRMLSPEALPLFVLSDLFGENSPALSFKIILKPDLNIEETEIIPSLVKVTRLTYEEADRIINDGSNALAALSALAGQNLERRLDSGAVVIELPEAHIRVSGEGQEKKISVEAIGRYRSAEMIRECMIWAGEGAARWALQRQLAFPFISQEAGELPGKRLAGFAGAHQIRRCMRGRTLSAKPAVHWGLGLDAYTQVTSPLRRYTDLLCHQQIRLFLGSGAYQGQKPLGEEEILLRALAAEAAAAITVRAERASRAHWLAVYLADKKDSLWDGVVLDRKGNKGTLIVPALGIETQVNLRGNEEPNENVKLKFSSVKIPEGEINFVTA